MRKLKGLGLWLPVGAVAALGLAVWGVWTYRLTETNSGYAIAMEAQDQRHFNDMSRHVEQMQALLGKALVTGSPGQNMRYMADVYTHSEAAATSFHSLPLPAQLGAGTGKFLRQVGDFSASLLRHEAAGREMDVASRAELGRLRTEAANLSAQLQVINADHNQGGFRWNAPPRFTWYTLRHGYHPNADPVTTQDQAPANLIPAGWDQVRAAMDKLPVMVYDGPFSDHVNARRPAMSGAPVARPEAESRMRAYLPGSQGYRVTDVAELTTNLPAYSFRLDPATAAPGAARGGAGDNPGWTTTVDVSKNGGFLVQLLNSRMVGNPTIDLARARALGQAYLSSVGYPGMIAAYGEVRDGIATIQYAYQEHGVLIYPDQAKVNVALDNGEILAVDARQYLMSHHPRSLPAPQLTPREAEDRVNPDLAVARVQLTLIPSLSGADEILAYEFLGSLGQDAYLVYINAESGGEEQVLQQVQTDGGTFAL
ncbi:MAG: hypothetical protein JWN15_4272 [Firmicutes bacterium]|nr:hypothetical protein [Bacillota bacterium]